MLHRAGQPAPSSALSSVRMLTLANLAWVVRHRAWTPWYLVRYARFARLKLVNPHIVLLGFVFLDRRAELYARRGYGRLIVGAWVHLGAGTALRCHEGTLRVGSGTTFGRNSSINTYLDVDIGESVLVADNVYVSDFDHRFAELSRPIREQGIVKARVRIGDDVWLGTKVTVARGVVIGSGAVIGANAVVTRDVPAYKIAVGTPARVIRDRRG
jgi:acetyltransferase-like isoleucine patch superfamily enzyme